MVVSGAEEFADFAMLTIEATGGIMVPEAARTSDPPLDTPMVLLRRLFKKALMRCLRVLPSTLRIALG